MRAEPIYRTLAVADIDAPAEPARMSIDDDALYRLADSMAAEGLHQPVGVTGPHPNGRYLLVWGHRRLLAARHLTWARIDCKVFPPEVEPYLARMSENLQRENLTPLEEAREIERAQARGMPLAGIARLWRRSDGWVRDRLDLLRFPEELRQSVHDGRLTLAVARALAEVDHDEYRGQLVREAERTGATTRTVNEWVAHYAADRERIVTNVLTVSEILARRAAWKLYVPCELCGEDVPYEQTRSLRACEPCLVAVYDLVAKAAAEAAGPGVGE